MTWTDPRLADDLGASPAIRRRRLAVLQTLVRMPLPVRAVAFDAGIDQVAARNDLRYLEVFGLVRENGRAWGLSYNPMTFALTDDGRQLAKATQTDGPQ